MVKESKGISLQATIDQAKVLRLAAAKKPQNVSEFILGSALSHAETVLADQRWFSLAGNEYDSFTELLDTPLDSKRLAALLQSEGPFGKELDLDQ